MCLELTCALSRVWSKYIAQLPVVHSVEEATTNSDVEDIIAGTRQTSIKEGYANRSEKDVERMGRLGSSSVFSCVHPNTFCAASFNAVMPQLQVLS